MGKSPKPEPMLKEVTLLALANAAKSILTDVDQINASTQCTPTRFAEAMADLLAGYSIEDPAEVVSTTFDTTSDELVVVRNITFFSLCEHHMLPFFGKAHVGYTPYCGKIVGLSKIPRLVEACSRRLQVQEHLTSDIAFALRRALVQAATDSAISEGQVAYIRQHQPNIAVSIEAEHMCMCMRGVRSVGSTTVTNSFHGAFREKDNHARLEFLEAIRG